MRHPYSKLWLWALPDPTVSLENQFFQGLCVLAGLLAIFVVVPVDFFQHLNPWVNRIIFLFGLVALGLAWEARRGRCHKKALLFAFVGCLDLLWFPNGGSQGSIGLYFVIASLFLVLFHQGAFRWVGLVLLVADVMALHLMEVVWPRLAVPFSAPMDRYLDLLTAYPISLLMSSLILWVILAGYNRERSRSRASLDAMNESEARLKAVFDSTADFIWSVDAEAFSLLTFNAGLRDYYLARRGLQLRAGMPQEELFPPGEHATFWVEAYRRALREGTYTTEYETSTRSNTLLITFNLLQHHGRTFGISAFGRDITENKRLERERKELEGQLRQIEKQESLGSLAGGVAHDMNNVLGAIMGLASTHGLRAGPDSVLARDMATVTRACQRGAILVRGLLDFARKRLSEERTLDLNALVREEVALLARTTLQRVRLVTDLADDLRPMVGDPGALTHALMNLCVNAVDAMPGGGTLTLRTWNGPAGSLRLEVEDTGCGMSREVLDKALDPFFTTKPQGKGTGLGLSIVFATVKAHGGRLELHSEPGHGTRILMTFPPPKAAATEQEAEPEAALQPQRAPLHLLVVDDDELVREAVAALLDYLGHTATVVAGGEEALANLRAGLKPDAVILDMNMPGMDGAETLASLRGLAGSLPVILATGRMDDRVRALAGTYADVTLLPKPFSIHSLQVALGRAETQAGIAKTLTSALQACPSST